MNIKVLRPEDGPSILNFETARLKTEIDDPMELELATWNARWRQEALDHYLPLGWCFAIWGNDSQLEGYFLAQPQLFTGGVTQALWVEHLSYASEEVGHKLVEVAYRTSREKHLQRVIFAGLKDFNSAFVGLKTQDMDQDLIVIKTAKYKDGV